ncbi:MAG: type II secretion system F family protein [Actinobacteria bacterium]|nr:type II secretion system F family protein [Actinomycetota bacterium]
MTPVTIAVVTVGFGLALVVVGVLLRARDRDERLLQLIDLPYGEDDVAADEVGRISGMRPTLSSFGAALERVHRSESLAADLERARVPLRAGEAVLLVAGAAVLLAAWTAAATGQLVFAPVAAVAVVFLSRWMLRRRIAARRRALEAQLPDALSLLASSLQGGHSLLHAVEHLAGEAAAPLAEELERVLTETRLGDPLVDSLERMAARLEIADLDWAVQAIRIQQSVGGRLADLLFTLSETLRARDEFRREVRVLTAEGRMSAAVLAGLPVFVLLGLQAANPSYMADLFTGVGLFLLGAAAVSVAIGVTIVLRMVKVEM